MKNYALRVFPAETRLTVYRRRQVRDRCAACCQPGQKMTNVEILIVFFDFLDSFEHSFSIFRFLLDRLGYCGSDSVSERSGGSLCEKLHVTS